MRPMGNAPRGCPAPTALPDMSILAGHPRAASRCGLPRGTRPRCRWPRSVARAISLRHRPIGQVGAARGDRSAGGGAPSRSTFVGLSGLRAALAVRPGEKRLAARVSAASVELDHLHVVLPGRGVGRSHRTWRGATARSLRAFSLLGAAEPRWPDRDSPGFLERSVTPTDVVGSAFGTIIAGCRSFDGQS